jgi:riboflavin synthase
MRMFTGIIEEVGRVISTPQTGLIIAAGDILKSMEPGGSIAVNGVCLTVTKFENSSFSAGVMQETLKRSNLGTLSTGDRVNLESPLTLEKPLGGHLVQGHVDTIGRLVSLRQEGEAIRIRFEADTDTMRYIVEKGFIAVDGISLTVTGRNPGSFEVSIIDYTRQHTNLGDRRVGDTVNLEVDIIAKYVEQLTQAHRTGVTAEFLQEHGFSVR